jgi:hypothetical protein
VFGAGSNQESFGIAKDSEANLGEQATKLLDLSNGGDDVDCPLNNIMRYDTKVDAESYTGGVEVSMTDFKDTADRSKITFFRVGTAGNAKDWSKVLSLKMIVCGDETFEADSIPRAINFIYQKGDDVEGQITHVTKDVY